MKASSIAPLALAAGAAIPLTANDLAAQRDPSASLVSHARRILQQNLLKAGETVVIATPYLYDPDYTLALLVAAGEIGARGAQVVVVPGLDVTTPPVPMEPDRRNGLTPWHYDLYATADLLITTSMGAPPGTPGPSTSYYIKVGNHPYTSDGDLLNRPGSKTRWLQLGFPVHLQRRYFPTADRRKRTLDGAILLDKTTTIRFTSPHGTNLTCTKRGRPGHAQYGIADYPGRWDNFGYGCVACMPNEDSAEGVLQLVPGDIITNLVPQIITEPVKLTFKGGYVTSVEGPGRTAGLFQNLLAGFRHKEAFGLSHAGWGTHERSEIGTGSGQEISHYHHNAPGSLLFALGMNAAHGTGGAETGYSGSGASTRVAPNHTHFAMFGCTVQLDNQRIIDNGQLLMG